jgi:hypothetical protein
VVRTPPGERLRWILEVPDGSWSWETFGPFVTGDQARIVLRCLAPPEVSCSFGQPHLLRVQ